MCLSSCKPELIKIEDIFENPGKYENEQVIISGMVNQYFPSTTKTTSYYLVQGNFGGVINVNTSLKPPITFKKYQITGVVVIDQVQGRPVIIEKSRKIILGWIFYALGGVVLVLIGFLLSLVIRGSKSTKAIQSQNSQTSSDKHGSANVSSQDYATIKISTGPPPTMILIPGELEIISGLDKGKSFRIAGYPTSDGSIVTVGRETVDSDKRYAHIQLLEKTVSRKQAELIYKNGILYIKNLSETNFTQIDGKVLSVNELAELKSGMTIRTGEVEFRYKR
jgi:hypothetical protein